MIDALIKLTNGLYKVTGLFPTKEPLKFAIRKEALDVLFFCIASDKQTGLSQAGQKEFSVKKAIDCLGLLKTYFEIAKQQHWVDNRNFLVMEDEYFLIEEILHRDLSKILSNKKIETEAKQNEDKLIAERKAAEEKKEELKKAEEKIKIEQESLKEKKIEAIIDQPVAKTKETAGSEKREALASEKTTEIDYEKLTGIQLKVLELLQGNGQLKPNEINKHFPNVTSRSIRRELKGLKERHIIGTIGTGRSVSYKINLEV